MIILIKNRMISFMQKILKETGIKSKIIKENESLTLKEFNKICRNQETISLNQMYYHLIKYIKI